MRKPVAALGSAVFFVIAPGTVGALIPWVAHRLAQPAGARRLVGAVPATTRHRAGDDGGRAAFVITAFVRFVVEGLGTPAPVAAPDRLVVGGIYRYVRNPMYVALNTCIAGQALLLNQPVLLLVAAITLACMVGFAKVYEEPTLARQFGADYAEYKAAVPGWWPPAAAVATAHPSAPTQLIVACCTARF
jgi:hypothetical protein